MIIRPAAPADATLPTFDYTKSTAINTCPTWGLVRYEKHLTVPRGGRAMALEIGAAGHEVFAASRYASLFEGSHHDLAEHRARGQFGSDRFDEAYKYFKSVEPLEKRRVDFALAILDTSSFYDDPSDKRRTRSNLSDACTAYLQRYNYEAWHPHVVPELGFVGIETPFDLVVEHDDTKFRFTGRVDAIIDNQKYNNVEPHENKTGSRINDAWALSFHMSHQVTGYCIAASSLLQREEFISDAVVHGLQIPLPRTFEIGGVVAERVTRNADQFDGWLTWMKHTLEIHEKWKDDPLSAPRYTHSCNRYFRPCPMIGLCSSTREEQEIILNTEYVVDQWSPLDEKVGD